MTNLTTQTHLTAVREAMRLMLTALKYKTHRMGDPVSLAIRIGTDALNAIGPDDVLEALTGASHGEWRDISSAPKDGTRILAWCAEYEAPLTLQFYGKPGWGVYNEVLPKYQPTHWQPLPTPREHNKALQSILEELDGYWQGGGYTGQRIRHALQQGAYLTLSEQLEVAVSHLKVLSRGTPITDDAVKITADTALQLIAAIGEGESLLST